MKKLLLIAAFTLTPPALGQDGMQKADFIAGMNQRFPDLFCQADQFARVCFTYDYQQCVKLTEAHLSDCMSSMEKEIPSVITSREQAGQWGQKIGQCAGSNFGSKQTADANVTPKCISVVGDVFANSLLDK